MPDEENQHDSEELVEDRDAEVSGEWEDGEDEDNESAPDKPKKEKKQKPPAFGNVKLIGLAGLVKEAQFSIALGDSAVIGRSSECDICLQDVPAAKAIEDNETLENHFRTVSRKHMKITYVSNKEITIEDMSSNGLFLDGKRIEGSVTIDDLVSKPHELKLGTTETFCLDWWKLVPKSSVKMVQVVVKKEPAEEEEGEAKKETGTIDS